jgi:general stress protein YciG
MTGTKKSTKKTARTLTKDDPNFYSKISKMAKKPRGGQHSPGSFKKGNDLAAKGGKASKRRKGKHLTDADIDKLPSIKEIELEYENVPVK